MPYNSLTNVFTRIWKFVDRSSAGAQILRSEVDIALDDIAAGVQAALEAVPGADLVIASKSFDSVALMKARTDLAAGDYVETLGYDEAHDGGGSPYQIKTLVDFGGTPDGLIDHLISGGALVAELQHNNIFNTQACGVRKGIESGDAWNNAMWRAAALAETLDAAETISQEVWFVGLIDVVTSKILHMSREPADGFSRGSRANVHVHHPGSFRAVGGGDFEDHLDSEMVRLTALHGSPVVLGSALAAKYLKADPQLAEFLGDKVERPLPLVNVSLKGTQVYLGDAYCDFWCSGFRYDRCSGMQLRGQNKVNNYRKYGHLSTKMSNNAIKFVNLTAKQWGQSDFTDHDGRMMPGGYSEARNMTGDSLVCLQKDQMWFGGNFGWGRTAITLLDKCGELEADRWVGRTIYPDYLTRWDDDDWDSHGGAINMSKWDRMAPSTGTGDCDFYGMHVMQGSGETADDDVIFRRDGLDFGGQTGIECWNGSNPANFYGCDIDSSITQIFGAGIRFFGPTLTAGNTAKHSCFHPLMRIYPARTNNFKAAVIKDWTGTIGFFSFDRGDVGAPDVVSFSGDYEPWNYRNRVDSGSHLGDVQYRGEITGGSGNLPSADVLIAGDFFWVTEAGTYGGQAMLAGDILYALTLAPGTSYGANWHLGANNDVDAKSQKRTVALDRPLNMVVGNETDQPAFWLTKLEGDNSIRLETGATSVDIVFDGTTLSSTMPMRNSSPTAPSGMGTGAGGSVTQITSRTTAVTLDRPCGEIILFSDAGSATPFSFTVNNTTVSAFDNIVVTQRTGSNKYRADVTSVGANSFEITVTAIVGTATEAPIFNFEIRNGTNS